MQFVVEQGGRIRVVRDGVLLATAFAANLLLRYIDSGRAETMRYLRLDSNAGQVVPLVEPPSAGGLVQFLAGFEADVRVLVEAVR